MSDALDRQNDPTPSSTADNPAPASYDPRAEYLRRFDARKVTAERLVIFDKRLSAARGFLFLVGLVLLLASVNKAGLSVWWLSAPIGVFIPLVLFHSRVVRRLTTARQAAEFYERALDRLDHRWIGKGATGNRYVEPHHAYTDDLDIFGDGSLFQLISSARTRLGEDTLAAWLSVAADTSTILARQEAIEDLRLRLDLREEVAVLGAEVHDDLDQNQLLDWSQQPPQPVSRGRVAMAVVLAAAFVISLCGWLWFQTGSSPVLVTLICEVLLLYSLGKQIRSVAKSVDRAGSGLAILSQVLAVIEEQQFQSARLKGLRATLDTDGVAPSLRIAQLRGLIGYLDNCLRNQFFAPLAFVLCLPIHVVRAIEAWRLHVGPSIPQWLATVGEIEALNSFAGYAYEHPNDPFPELVDGGPHFEAEALGHPLLSESECVRNDLSVGGDLRLVLVSGSNMSGKSTLLRSVGTSIVLALAGAPVRASRLRLSRMQLGTAIRVQDSLQAGASLFYAAVSRIKFVVTLSEQPAPLLFLFDEILQGTNSHDRRVGAEGIIRQLVDRDAVGLVTTHDLALTGIVDTLHSRAVNVHFEDQLAEGKMTFDYRLRPGVVRKSNALELMRLVGLDIPEPEPD